jgi:hypothetical protein
MLEKGRGSGRLILKYGNQGWSDETMDGEGGGGGGGGMIVCFVVGGPVIGAILEDIGCIFELEAAGGGVGVQLCSCVLRLVKIEFVGP